MPAQDNFFFPFLPRHCSRQLLQYSQHFHKQCIRNRLSLHGIISHCHEAPLEGSHCRIVTLYRGVPRMARIVLQNYGAVIDLHRRQILWCGQSGRHRD